MGISLSIFVSIYPCWIILLTSYTFFATVACYPFTFLILSFLISSTLTLLMVKDGICNANDHSNDYTMNPPPLD
jgi:hypothetical protein